MVQVAFVATLLLGQALAGSLESVAAPLITREDIMEGSIRRYAADLAAISHEASSSILRRQSGTPATGMTVAAWDAQTQLACTSTLEKLNGKASNDAGMAVCYNIPLLNVSTGVFQADLRLFKVAEPTGDFANIPTQDVQVGLKYVGAQVQPIDKSQIGRRAVDGRSEEMVSLISWPKRRNIEGRQAAFTPVIVQAYAFTGLINKDLMGISRTDKELEKLLQPTVTLSGVTASGVQVNATLDSNEASFVSGVFAVEVAPKKTFVQPPIQTLVVAPDAPFIVPGMNIMIFPIGGIITSIWAFLLLGTIGYGTMGRIQFRDQFRRRNTVANDVTARI